MFRKGWWAAGASPLHCLSALQKKIIIITKYLVEGNKSVSFAKKYKQRLKPNLINLLNQTPTSPTWRCSQKEFKGERLLTNEIKIIEERVCNHRCAVHRTVRPAHRNAGTNQVRPLDSRGASNLRKLL